MDSETLERLMLDRGLGALPPDCEALLATYLETCPAAAASGREIKQVVHLVQRALADNRSTPLPAFPVSRLLQTQRSIRAWRVARNVTGIAASILIGFAAHAAMFQTTPPSVQPTAPVVVAHAEVELTPAAAPEDAGFWSGRRLCEQASGTPRQTPNRLTWNSPVRVPYIRGAS